MRSLILLTTILLINTPGFAAIYGTDDRVDVEQAADARVREWSASVAAVFSKEIKTRPLSELFGAAAVCSTERFYDQHIGATCSATLIKEDLVLTARHCVFDAKECSDTLFVFDYKMSATGEAPQTSPENTYRCKEIVTQSRTFDLGNDWTLVRLDRPAAGRAVLTLADSANTQVQDPLMLIGTPIGLPLKAAPGEVTFIAGPYFFRTDLDAYAYNSGSPVIDRRSGEVVGLLTGNTSADWEQDETHKCWRSRVLPLQSQEGPGVVGTRRFIDTVKKYL